MGEPKDFETIQREFAAGLTGDAARDLAYLSEKRNEYLDHPLRAEIGDAFSEAAYRHLPADRREVFKQLLGDSSGRFGVLFREIESHFYEDENEEALSLCERMISEFEAACTLQDTDAVEYRAIDDPFAGTLYRMRFSSNRKLIPVNGDFAGLYYYYGAVLNRLNRPEEARAALEKGLRLDPVDGDLTIEYIETFKKTGDLEKVRKLALDGFKTAYRPHILAVYYYDLAYYYERKGLLREAAACYVIGLDMDDSPGSEEEDLERLLRSADPPMTEPTPQEIMEIAERSGIPTEPDEDVVCLARTLGFDAEASGELADAVRLLTIAYELTYDEELEPVLDDLKRRMRKEETKAAKKRRPLSPAQRARKKKKHKR